MWKRNLNTPESYVKTPKKVGGFGALVRFDFAEYALILKRYMIHKNALELIGALYDSIVVPLDLKN